MTTRNVEAKICCEIMLNNKIEYYFDMCDR